MGGFLSRFISGAGKGLSEVGGEMLRSAETEGRMARLEEIRAQREREAEERKNAIRTAERGEDKVEKQKDRQNVLDAARIRLREDKGSLVTDPDTGRLGRVGRDNRFEPITDLEGKEIGGNKNLTDAERTRLKLNEKRIANLDRELALSDNTTRPMLEAKQAEILKENEAIYRGKEKQEVDTSGMIKPSLFDGSITGPETGPLTSSAEPAAQTPAKAAPSITIGARTKQPDGQYAAPDGSTVTIKGGRVVGVQ